MALVYKFLITFSVVFGLLFLWTWGVYNSLIRKRNQLKTDLSDINVQIKQKLELAGRLVEMVREYSKHEKKTFENVSKARSALEKSEGVKDSTKVDNMLADTLRSIMLVVENYPKLQASKNFQDLRVDLKEIEGRVAGYREEYNKSVQRYNNAVQTFPNMLISSLLGFKEEALFQITEAA